jgi:hypothetical protein
LRANVMSMQKLLHFESKTLIFFGENTLRIATLTPVLAGSLHLSGR